MSWLCDRCERPDKSLGDEKPSITISIILSFAAKNFSEKKEICSHCFHDLNTFWDLPSSPADVQTETVDAEPGKKE